MTDPVPSEGPELERPVEIADLAALEARPESAPPAGATRLELRGISKSFGGVRVLRDVDFHALGGRGDRAAR